MIPIGDDNSSRKTTPVVTYCFIFLNILIFLCELVGGETFVLKWAFTPEHFLANPLKEFPTLFTSMFMHAGWAHLIGNMIYLWIFGDNVEDKMSKARFIFFYLLCGLIATFAQLIFIPNSTIPNLGASGAIAGVLGAYILLFPQGKVKVLLGSVLTQLPAIAVIGFWFLLQFFSSFSSEASSGETGGVAYMAHIGGFAAGLILAKLFTPRNFQRT